MSGGGWYATDFILKLNPAIASSSALALDAFGSLIVNAGGALSISGGTLIITSGSITVGYLPAGTSFNAAVSGLPSLPSVSYPSGCWIFNLWDGRQYYNKAGTWIDKGSPGDMVTGTLAAGVIYAGAIACSQLVAGTITAAIQMTSPILVITGGGFTVNLDSTNGFKMTSTGTGSDVVTINSAYSPITGDYYGIGITDVHNVSSFNYTNTLVMAGSQVALVAGNGNMAVKLFGGYGPSTQNNVGEVSVGNGSGGSEIVLDGGTPSGAGIRIATGQLTITSMTSATGGSVSGTKRLYYDPTTKIVYFGA
jgi:hypothetical protein